LSAEILLFQAQKIIQNQQENLKNMKNHDLPQYWNPPFADQLPFFPHIFACSFSFLAVVCGTQALLCLLMFVDFAFLSVVNARWKLIFWVFFLMQSIPPVCTLCTLKAGCGPRRFKRTNSPAA
jgi:hypothetical protein